MDSYLERLRQAITSATSDMSIEQLTRKPEGKWSAAQVLEHLYLTYTGTQKAFERCLKAGKPLAGIPTFKQRVSTAAVTELGYFPKGRKSPDQVLPRGMAGGKDRRRYRSPDRRHGQCHRAMRRALWVPHQGTGSSCSWTSDGEAMAKVSPRPRTPSRKADCENENNRKQWRTGVPPVPGVPVLKRTDKTPVLHSIGFICSN